MLGTYTIGALSSEDSLTCYVYCDMRVNPLLWSSPRARDYHTCRRAFGRGPSVATSLKDLGLSRTGIEPRSPACQANDLLTHHRNITKFSLSFFCNSFNTYFLSIHKKNEIRDFKKSLQGKIGSQNFVMPTGYKTLHT